MFQMVQITTFAGLGTFQMLSITASAGPVPASNGWSWKALHAGISTTCWSCNAPLLQLVPWERSGLLELVVLMRLKFSQCMCWLIRKRWNRKGITTLLRILQELLYRCIPPYIPNQIQDILWKYQTQRIIHTTFPYGRHGDGKMLRF